MSALDGNPRRQSQILIQALDGRRQATADGLQSIPALALARMARARMTWASLIMRDLPPRDRKYVCR